MSEVIDTLQIDQSDIARRMRERREQRLKAQHEKPEEPQEDTDTPNAPARHFLHKRIHKLIELRLNVWLVGPAGSGKSKTIELIAEDLNLPYYAPPIGRETTITSLFGYLNANGEYVRTPLREGFENGGIVALEEIDFASPAVGTALNTLLAADTVGFPDGTVKKHKDCIIIACANTFGTGSNRQYIGSTGLNAATLDRFAFVEYPYDETLERKISPVLDWTLHVQSTRKKVEKLALQHVVSPRASITGGKMIQAGIPFAEVEKMVLFRGLDEITVNKINAVIL